MDLVNAYSEAKVSSVAETTMSNFLCKMNGVILPELGHLQVMRITAKRIDQHVDTAMHRAMIQSIPSILDPKTPG